MARAPPPLANHLSAFRAARLGIYLTAAPPPGHARETTSTKTDADACLPEIIGRHDELLDAGDHLAALSVRLTALGGLLHVGTLLHALTAAKAIDTTWGAAHTFGRAR